MKIEFLGDSQASVIAEVLSENNKNVSVIARPSANMTEILEWLESEKSLCMALNISPKTTTSFVLCAGTCDCLQQQMKITIKNLCTIALMIQKECLNCTVFIADIPMNNVSERALFA